MPAGLEDIRATLQADRKKGRRVLVISVILFLAFCLMVLCFNYQDFVDYARIQWITPGQALRSIYNSIKLRIQYWTGGASEQWSETFELLYRQLPDGHAPMERLLQLCLTAVSGAVLSLSGTVYQSAMRNPMAVPTMLGVTGSTRLAKLLIITYMGINALYNMSWQYYALSYGLTAIVLIIILIAGKLAGGKHVSVVDMLLVGTVINWLMQSFTSYLRDRLDEDTLIAFHDLNARAYDYYDQLQNLLIIVIVSLVIMIPILLMRFSYNAISFDDEDARSFGVNPNAMRVYAIIAGAILTTATEIHFGDIGTLALIIPHICRYVFGSDFRRVVTTSAFYGAFFLVVGWFISNFTWIGNYQISVGDIISVIVLPVLFWFSFKQHRGWE